MPPCSLDSWRQNSAQKWQWASFINAECSNIDSQTSTVKPLCTRRFHRVAAFSSRGFSRKHLSVTQLDLAQPLSHFFFFSTPRIFRQLKWVGAALIIMRIPVAGSNAVTRFLLQERACVISRVDLLWHSNMFHARSNLLSSAYFLRTDIHVTTPQEHLMEVGGNKRPFSSQPRPIISWPLVLSKLSCCPLPPEPLTLAVWMKKAQREGWQKRRQSLSTTGIQCCPLMVILSNYGFANYSRQTAAHTRTLPHHPF